MAGDRFVAVGASAQMRKFAGEGTRVADVKGERVSSVMGFQCQAGPTGT
jgi:predicted amidohydrolase YtcJ